MNDMIGNKIEKGQHAALGKRAGLIISHMELRGDPTLQRVQLAIVEEDNFQGKDGFRVEGYDLAGNRVFLCIRFTEVDPSEIVVAADLVSPQADEVASLT